MATTESVAKRLNKHIDKKKEGEHGELGRWDGGNSYTVPVSGVINGNWVRINGDPAQTVVATNIKTAWKARLGVLLHKNTSGFYVVDEVDPLHASDFMGDAAPSANMPPTQGSAVNALWESHQFKPGRVRALNGTDLQVFMEELPYGDTDLGNVSNNMTTAVAGITSSKKVWVVVSVNPTTNVLSFTKGTEYGYPVVLTKSLAAQVVVPAGDIKLWAYILRSGATYIPVAPQSPDTLYFVDLRAWLTLPAAAGTDTSAVHVDVAGEIAGITQKASPISADKLLIEDSADSDNKKYIEIGDLPGGGGSATDYILIQDRKTANTDGGTFTSGADRTRDLNTIADDTTGAVSIGSNQITLPAGTYRATIEVPGFYINRHRAHLYNITDSAIQQTVGGLDMLGSSEFSSNAITNGVTNKSIIKGRFTIAGTKVFEVRHRCETTMATFGFGVADNFGVEVYTTVELIKE